MNLTEIGRNILPPSSGSKSKLSVKLVTLLATCFHAGFLCSLFFDPEGGGNTFLQNVGWLSMNYTALYPRR
jgi:hypothetical protein